jgi:nicotinamide mononucleotide transporter
MNFSHQSLSNLEIVGFLTGLASVWLSRQMSVSNWPVGLVSVACFAVLFLNAKLYADALLQFAFGIVGLYGWWRWTHDASRTGVPRPCRMSVWQRTVSFTIAGVLTVAVAYPLARFTDSPLPYPDAAIFSFSMVAIWAQAKRFVENWLIWIAVDVVSIPVYWSRQLPLTALLYAIFMILCVFGLLAWKRAESESGPSQP